MALQNMVKSLDKREKSLSEISQLLEKEKYSEGRSEEKINDKLNVELNTELDKMFFGACGRRQVFGPKLMRKSEKMRAFFQLFFRRKPSPAKGWALRH